MNWTDGFPSINSGDVVGYTLAADNFCGYCIVSMVVPDHDLRFTQMDPETALGLLAQERNINRNNEHSFDSGDFPKVIYTEQLEDDDRCGCCGVLIADTL